jgi:hypothetical protein
VGVDLSPAERDLSLSIKPRISDYHKPIGHSGLSQFVSRPPSLTTDIHSESVADTPSITMGDMIKTTL